MTEWEMDTGHVRRLNVLGVYEENTSWSELIADKLGHWLPQCRTCSLNSILASLDTRGEDTAEVEREKVLGLAANLGPQRLRQWAAEEADELLAMDPGPRRAVLEDDHPFRYRFPHLVDELLERCQAHLTKNARRALELAELAVDVSLRPDPKVFHDQVFHTRARAAAHRANCLRLNDQRPAAEEAFQHAYGLYQQAQTRDLEVEAELPYLGASLAIDQRRFDEAEALLTHAATLYRRLDMPGELALTRINHANLQYHRGHPGAGLPALEEAASLLELDDEPQLHWTIRYSQSLCAVEVGDVGLAREQFQRHRSLLESQSES